MLRTEMLLFVLLLLCRTAILCNLGKGGFGPRILLKGLGVWYAFGLLACAYLCFLYVLDVAQDGLTGLNNRRRLDQYMWELDERSGERETCCYLLMDVNKFKKVNDTYGHVTGDEVLRLVAEQLKRTFGNMQAFLARYGGDEFVVIVKGKTQDEMDVIIHQTQENVNAIAWGADTPWQLSISIGCAMRGEQGKQKSHELLALADERMYRQKKGIQDR